MFSSHEARAAVREVLPIIAVVVPFGAVYGAFATSAGLSTSETLGFGALIYAGASQLAAVQMIAHGAPVWAILLSIFALNFRHVLYSASTGRLLTRFSPMQKALAFFLLVDPVFGAVEERASHRVLTKTFYFGYGIALYVSWVLSCWLGVVFGRLVTDPHAVALDFILPVYFLALVIGFRRREGFWPVALVSATASALLYKLFGPPWHVTFGGVAGVVYAALAAPKPAARAEAAN